MELAPTDLAEVVRGPLRASVPLSGTLRPFTQTVVRTRVAGTLEQLDVREGETVRRGQLLATQEDLELRARVAERRASLAGARAQRELARKNRDNHQQLLASHFISRNALDTSESALAVAESGVAAAEAQLELALKALADARLLAPMAGVVAERFAQPGEKLPVDARVVSLVDLSRLELEAEVPASDLPSVRPGAAVDFTVDGLGRQRFRGRVERLNPAADERSRALRVYARLDNGDGALRAGMFAKGTVAAGDVREAVLVPAACVRDESGQAVAFTLEDGRVVRRPLRLGGRDAERDAVEVLEGLAPGAKVLLASLGNLRPGDRARVVAPATR